MKRSEVQIVVQVGSSLKRRLVHEAERRGVEPSALVRAVLRQYLEDLGGEMLGWLCEDGAVIQVERVAFIEIVVPVRQTTRRSRAGP